MMLTEKDPKQFLSPMGESKLLHFQFSFLTFDLEKNEIKKFGDKSVLSIDGKDIIVFGFCLELLLSSRW
jgi:hypothetical protein